MKGAVLLAYEGRDDCTSDFCRRFLGSDEPGCVGWHCAGCDRPSSQYGHRECVEPEDVTACNGQCIEPENAGALVAGLEVAYLDPDCPLHGQGAA